MDEQTPEMTPIDAPVAGTPLSLPPVVEWGVGQAANPQELTNILTQLSSQGWSIFTVYMGIGQRGSIIEATPTPVHVVVACRQRVAAPMSES